MTLVTSPISLFRVADASPVDALLVDGITERQLDDWQTKWLPARDAEHARRRSAGRALPSSSHWDWARKLASASSFLALHAFCVEADGCTQGLMVVDLAQHFGRLVTQKGKPLVYIKYLEVAPWNQPGGTMTCQFRGVGTALLFAAIALSVDEEFRGRVGLHSLPEADGFYSQFGMTDCGADAAVPGTLKYYELSEARAVALLATEKSA